MGLATSRYLAFYLGCNTNKGKLVGITEKGILVLTSDGTVAEQSEHSIKLFLKKISKITIEESGKLIELGFAIGRPGGYSFTPEAFVYLLSLHVDLFGLIGSGMATDIDLLQKT